MSRPKVGMTKNKQIAAQMLADGFTLEQISAEIGVPFQTIGGWKRDDEFLDFADNLSKKNVIASAFKARLVLDKHMQDKGAWIAMNASTSVLREYQTVKGIGGNTITVSFGNEAMQPGIPPNVETDNDA